MAMPLLKQISPPHQGLTTALLSSQISLSLDLLHESNLIGYR